MQAVEEGVSNPQTEEEIAEAIKKYQKRVEDIIAAENQIGIWYKILGVRYLDNGMYEKALEAFKSAAEYHTDNQNLYYYIGVCAGHMANAELEYPGGGAEKMRNAYLALAESAYLRALELEPRYVRSLYGLSVLYTFELNKADEAVPLLERLLTIDTKHVDAMFVLARAYYMVYEHQAAADMYDRILHTTKNQAKRAKAEENKKKVLDDLYAGG